MKKIFLLLCGLVLYSCQENVEEIQFKKQNAFSQKVLSISEINKHITSQLKQKGDMVWKDPLVLWSAAMHGDSILTIGYGKKGQSFAGHKSLELQSFQKKVLNTISEMENNTEDEVLLNDDAILNVVDVKISSYATVETLLAKENIRYIEPNGYSYYQPQNQNGAKQLSGSGCNQEKETVNTEDYKIITPGSLLPWNFSIHNINKAWEISTGKGVTIGLIDTGISNRQSLLNNEFNDGFSNNRKVERFGVFTDSFWRWRNNPDGPDDKCGHGTDMAGALLAPRNNNNMPVGVAYNSNLVSYRATEDVIINDFHEKKGVSDALKRLADRKDVKIISISLGSLFSIGNVKDAVQYANAKGKLIFAAGGTSTAVTNFVGVTFPANMKETVAVTGITDNGKYTKCRNCHSGKEIDFTIVMQRARKGDRVVPVIGFNSNEIQYSGGSSIATAISAGIAALVWEKNPSWNKDQVLEKLKQSGELFGNKSDRFGYGNIDALKAVD